MSAIIGYWCRTANDEADALLKRCLESRNGTESVHDLRLAEQADWQSTGCSRSPFCIAFFGAHTHTITNNHCHRVWLSASGLSNETDILIEASPDHLTLRRDSFGRALLFWTERDGVVWFASQLRLLLPALENTAPSLAAFYAYTCFSWIPNPLAPLENVFTVPAGKEVVFERGSSAESGSIQTGISTGSGSDLVCSPISRIEIHQVATAPCTDSAGGSLTEADAIAQLRTLLHQSINDQIANLTSETVGVFLSGGLDSSVVAALLVRAGVNVKAFALDFGEYGLSELPFAESVAQHLGIPLVKVNASPRRIRQAIRATMHALDVPFGDGVTAPLYLLGEAARREVSVVFNGEGGDQLFAGWTNKPLIAAGVYEQSHPSGDAFEQAYLRTFHRLHSYEASVFTEKALAQIAALNPREWIAEALDEARSGDDLLYGLRRANLRLKGAQNIQPRATNLALAHGLQLRTPFCSRALAEWSLRISGDWWLRGACEKYLLKRAVEDWLPSEIVWREKRGMGVPQTQWCLGPLWRELGRWLRPDALRAEGILQPDLALRIATGRLSGQMQGRRIGELLWLLLAWQVWKQEIQSRDSHGAAVVSSSLYNPFWLPPRVWQWRYNASSF